MAKKAIKNHERLDLSFAEFGALLGARTLLATGALVHGTKPDGKIHAFDMGFACRTKDCGSVACIGGTMAQIMGMNDDDAVSYVADKEAYDPIGKLFYPPDNIIYETITPRQAIKAIDNFLATGKPLWNKILTKKNRY